MADARRTYDDKLEHLLRTAAAVFASKGYHSASIRDISRATGISLSGLYYYFRSKEELLFLIQDHCFATVVDNLEERLADVDDPAERVHVLIDTHLHFFVANMDEMKVLSHEASALTGDYRQQVNARKKRYVELCEGVLQELRPDDSAIGRRAAALSLFGMMNWIYTWYHPERDLPIGELVDVMTGIFLNGYATAGRAGRLARTGGGSERPSIWRK
jgi:AcrR family transcriptional regulator